MDRARAPVYGRKGVRNGLYPRRSYSIAPRRWLLWLSRESAFESHRSLRWRCDRRRHSRLAPPLCRAYRCRRPRPLDMCRRGHRVVLRRCRRPSGIAPQSAHYDRPCGRPSAPGDTRCGESRHYPGEHRHDDLPTRLCAIGSPRLRGYRADQTALDGRAASGRVLRRLRTRPFDPDLAWRRAARPARSVAPAPARPGERS